MRYRLRIAVTICFLAFFFSGCLRYQPVAARAPLAKPVDASLSEYIRSVLRLSTGNTVANDEALAKLHKENLEIAALAQRVADSPQDLDATRSLARTYLEEGFPTNAFQLYQQLQLRAPEDPDAHIGLALIWDGWKDYDLALQYATRAAALSPDYAPALETMGRVYLHRNELNNALAAFLAAVQATPDSASLLANTGYIYILCEDWENARRFLEQAVAIDGTIAEARNNLGIVLALTGDREGALRQFLAVHDAAAAHNNLGVTYMGIGNFELAQEEFRMALAASPHYYRAAMNLKEAESHMPPPAIYNVQPFPGSNPAAPARMSKGLLNAAALEYRPISPLSLTDYMRRLFRLQVDAAVDEALAPYRPASIAENLLAQDDEVPVIADVSQFRQISAKGLEAAEDLAAIMPPVTEEAVPQQMISTIASSGALLPAGMVTDPKIARDYPLADARGSVERLPSQVPAVVVLVPFTPPEPLAATANVTAVPARAGYSVQVFAGKDEKAALAQNEALSKGAGVGSAIERADLKDRGIWYRARIRGYETFSAALAAAKQLVIAGIIKGYWIAPPNY